MEKTKGLENIESLALQRLLSNLPRDFVQDQKVKELLTDPNLSPAEFKQLENKILEVDPLALYYLNEAVSSLIDISMDKSELYNNSFGKFFSIREIRDKINAFRDNEPKELEIKHLPLADAPQKEVAKQNRNLDFYSRLKFATIISITIAATYFIPTNLHESQNDNCQAPKIEIPKQITGY
jgi:hypothetical protein